MRAEMFASRPVVHPLEVAAPAHPVQQPAPGVLMKDLPGMPGTPGGLGLRVLQLLFAAISLAVMSSTADFASVSAFWYASSLLFHPPPHHLASFSSRMPRISESHCGFGGSDRQ